MLPRWPVPAMLAMLATASCMPIYYYDEFNETRSGKAMPSAEAALLQSGREDLGCDDVQRSRVPIHGGGRYGASVDAVDGCGRRAVYGTECTRVEAREVTPGGDEATRFTSTCHPSLLARVSLAADSQPLSSK